MKTLDALDARLLARFLSNTDRPEGTLSYAGLQGFLFAVVCSPVAVRPPDWLPVIFDGDSAHFESKGQEDKVLDSIARLYSILNASFIDEIDELPDCCAFLTEPLANFDPDSSVAQWSQGFERGHRWLGGHWETVLEGDSLDDAAGAAAALTFFASRDDTEAMLSDDGLPVNAHELTGICQSVQRMFPNALCNYADIAREYEARQVDQTDEDFASASATDRVMHDMLSVDGDDPCPCGSGRKYQRCCGSNLH